jgi:hypothetical protein
MSIHSFPSSQTAATRAPDPVLQAGLAELFQLGLAVARVCARLAEVEGRAVEVLAEEAAETTRGAFVQQTSWADAVHAGHKMDTSEAARDVIAARIASITQSFDQAARAVRRTAALQARLAEGWPSREQQRWAQEPGRERQVGAGGAARPPANDAERADRRDDPEWGDEIAGRSDEEVVRDICRDLGAASAGLGQGETPLSAALPAAIREVCAQAGRTDGAPGARNRIVEAGLGPADPAGLLPEPDT